MQIPLLLGWKYAGVVHFNPFQTRQISRYKSWEEVVHAQVVNEVVLTIATVYTTTFIYDFPTCTLSIRVHKRGDPIVGTGRCKLTSKTFRQVFSVSFLDTNKWSLIPLETRFPAHGWRSFYDSLCVAIFGDSGRRGAIEKIEFAFSSREIFLRTRFSCLEFYVFMKPASELCCPLSSHFLALGYFVSFNYENKKYRLQQKSVELFLCGNNWHQNSWLILIATVVKAGLYEIIEFGKFKKYVTQSRNKTKSIYSVIKNTFGLSVIGKLNHVFWSYFN